MIQKDVQSEWHRWDIEYEKQLTGHIEFFSKLKLKRIYKSGKVHKQLTEILEWAKGERDAIRGKNIERKADRRTPIRY